MIVSHNLFVPKQITYLAHAKKGIRQHFFKFLLFKK